MGQKLQKYFKSTWASIMCGVSGWGNSSDDWMCHKLISCIIINWKYLNTSTQHMCMWAKSHLPRWLIKIRPGVTVLYRGLARYFSKFLSLLELWFCAMSLGEIFALITNNLIMAFSYGLWPSIVCLYLFFIHHSCFYFNNVHLYIIMKTKNQFKLKIDLGALQTYPFS